MPLGTVAASKANEWIPCHPATDGALALGMVYVLLLEQGVYDAQFLKQWTNAPYLIGSSDGYYVRDPTTKKPMVWDAVDKVAKTYDDKAVKDYALEGTYTVAGKPCSPAFALLKDRIRTEGYTPEWAATVTGASAQDIRRLATEWGNTASIGSTVTINGVVLPYRPVVIAHGAGSGSGHLSAIQSMGMPLNLLPTLVGAQSVPGAWYCKNAAIGGRNFNKWIDGLNAPLTPTATPWVYPPTSNDLSEFFPIGFCTTWIPSLKMAHPDKYYGGQKADLVFLRKANPLIMNYASSDLEELYATMTIISISDLIDETGLYSDIIIPESTMHEGWQFAMQSYDLGIEVKGWITQPVVTPLYNLPNVLDNYIEIADRTGFLYGKGGLNDRLNGQIPTADQKLDLNTKYTSKDVVSHIAASITGKDLQWAMQNGGVQGPEDMMAQYQPYKTLGVRLPIYMEWQKEVGDALKVNMDKAGIQWDYASYDPLPRWIPSFIHKDTPPYDLITAPYRKIGFSATNSRALPYLMEAQETDPYTFYLWMNENTAKAKGISDGDLLWVESVQDKVQGIAKLSQGIHPKAVGICINPGGYAVNEVVKSYNLQHLGVQYMRLRPWGFDYCDKQVANLENAIKVKVYKA